MRAMILLSMALVLCGCSSKTFRDRAQDYRTMTAGPGVELPAALNAQKSDLFEIPVAKGDQELFDLLPPEYNEFRT